MRKQHTIYLSDAAYEKLRRACYVSRARASDIVQRLIENQLSGTDDETLAVIGAHREADKDNRGATSHGRTNRTHRQSVEGK